MTKLEKIIAEEVTERLEEWEGEIDEPYDLAFDLYEEDYRNGTCTFSRQEAIDWIKDNFEDLAEYVEDYEQEYGECYNPLFIAYNLLERKKSAGKNR